MHLLGPFCVRRPHRYSRGWPVQWRKTCYPSVALVNSLAQRFPDLHGLYLGVQVSPFSRRTSDVALVRLSRALHRLDLALTKSPSRKCPSSRQSAPHSTTVPPQQTDKTDDPFVIHAARSVPPRPSVVHMRHTCSNVGPLWPSLDRLACRPTLGAAVASHAGPACGADDAAAAAPPLVLVAPLVLRTGCVVKAGCNVVPSCFSHTGSFKLPPWS